MDTTTEITTPTADALALALREGRAEVTPSVTAIDTTSLDRIQSPEEGDGWSAYPSLALRIGHEGWTAAVPVWVGCSLNDGCWEVIERLPELARADCGKARVRVGRDADGWHVAIAPGDNLDGETITLAAADRAEAERAAQDIEDALSDAYWSVEVPRPEAGEDD